MDLIQYDPNWCLPSLMDENPMAWYIMVDGMVLDARQLPFHIQKAAYDKGLIPYIPGKKKSRKAGENTEMNEKLLYRLQVFLRSGPVTEAFVKQNPVVTRTIEIRGDQTLADLHEIIFEAYDREEEHLYEFQVKGAGPTDPMAERYVHPAADDGDSDGLSTETTIGSLDLAVDEPFGYWFDFGDEWRHQINVIAIDDKIPQGRFPKITAREGDSPPQYTDFD